MTETDTQVPGGEAITSNVSIYNKLDKLSMIKDWGQTNHVTALPRPYALDTDLWP